VWPVLEAILVVWAMEMMFGSTTVRIGDGELRVTWRLLGIPISTRRIPSGDVRDVRSIAGMTAGRTVYRRIQVRCQSTRELNFGDGIGDPIEADWLASKIGEALGLTVTVAQNTMASGTHFAGKRGAK
jgi:hypothetical protein